MTGAEVIKEFLVGLGYKIDEGQFKKFEAGLNRATKVAMSLGKATTAAAVAVEAAVVRISRQFEDLYYAGKRLNSTVEDIRATEFAYSQVGGSAAGARAAMESVAEFMRSNPGGERFLQGLGVQTRGANGELRETTQIMDDLAASFRQMPYFAAKVRANLLGIDERTLQAMIRGTGEFSDRYHEMARRVGVDQDAAAKASHEFMVDLRDLLALLTLTADKLILKFQPSARAAVRAIEDLDIRTHGLSTALIEIGAVLGGVLLLFRPWVAALFEALGGMEALGAVAAGLGVLLSGPVGWILALVAAIAALLLSSDDFRKRFGDMLGEVLPQVQAALGDLWGALKELGAALKPVLDGIVWLFGKLRDAVVATFGPAVTDLVRRSLGFVAADLRLVGDAVRVVADLLSGRWSKAWTDAKNVARDAVDGIKAIFGIGGGASAPRAGSAPARSAAPAAGAGGPSGGRSVTDQIRAFFQANGVSAEVSKGISAGVWAEALSSGKGVNVVNPTSGAYGIGQWLGARKAELFRRYGPNPSLSQQLEFMLWELRGGDKGGRSVLRQTDAHGALEAYVNDFMRPAKGAETIGDLRRGGQFLAANDATQTNLGVSRAAAAQVSVSQKTDVHIHGVSDPHAAGRAVVAEQDRVNGNLVRNTAGAVR
jgi:hypothetical protein